MNKEKRKERILEILGLQHSVRFGVLLKYFDANRSTVYRTLQELINEERVVQVSQGVYALKKNTNEYLEQPYFERQSIGYIPNFLGSYVPNKTKFFSVSQRQELKEMLHNQGLSTNYLIENKRLLETILIDLSYASSSLEGNTYSYLETDVLIKYNEVAHQKALDETQMILNHKRCIEYMIYHKDELQYTKKTLEEMHMLLSHKLLQQQYEGVIRNQSVGIALSAYVPMENPHQLLGEMQIFLEKLNSIKDPFEQSILILTFLPYFQLFMDCNKRTSRMLCNLPLIKHNLPVLSLVQASKKEYITAMLAIYELQDVSLLADLYVKNYLLNMQRYT